ncbi:hypothetical protein ACFE04_002656 [Oxalis oulophora]
MARTKRDVHSYYDNLIYGSVLNKKKVTNHGGGNLQSGSSAAGYNPKRKEFDIEYDNDAEKLLADMEFNNSDTEDERELKLRIIGIYNKRLDERQRRKEFVLERNLLNRSAVEKDLSPEEKALCRRYDNFMRFHSKEEHEDLLKTVISEHRTLRRINELKEARAAGCRTSGEADIYHQQKRKREAVENSRRVAQAIKGGQNTNINNMAADGNGSSSRVAGQEYSPSDIMGAYESMLLSESEKRMCSEIGMHPGVYLKMQEELSKDIFKGNVLNKCDAHQMFKMESSKIDRVYDMLVKKGIAQPESI